MEISTIGIDLSKTTFHLIGLSPRGEIVLRKKLSRKQLLTHAIKAIAHEIKIRRWPTFTPPQNAAQAAHCG
jgi:hypothetical protein